MRINIKRYIITCILHINMKSLFKKLQKNKKKLFIFTGIALAILLFFILKSSGTETVSAQFAVVETIERGTVSSGIETTGTIVAADIATGGVATSEILNLSPAIL